MANYNTLKTAIQEVINTNGNKEITGQVLQDSLIAMINSLGAGYQFVGVATPETNPGTPDQNVFYIGGAGTYSNFGTAIVIPQGSLCVFAYNGEWVNITISLANIINDLITGGANGVLSAEQGRNLALQNGYFTCGTGASTAAKTVSATGFYLPASGGSIKIKFTYANTVANPTLNINSTGDKAIIYNGAVASSTNSWAAGEVVEFYYDPTYNSNAGGFVGRSTVIRVEQNTLNIGGVDKGELAGQLIENNEWVKVVTDSQDKILYGVKADGKFYFGDGCPTQVVEYIQKIINGLSLDEYEDIVSFLGNLIDGDTLATLLNEKVDKVTGKSLIDAEFASSQEVIETPEYIHVITDSTGRIVECRKTDGTKIEYCNEILKGNLYLDCVSLNNISSPEWAELKTDSNGRIISGRTKDGVEKVFIPVQFDESYSKKNMADIIEVKDRFILSTTAIANLKKDIDELPSYWYTYLATKESKIQEAVANAGNHGDLFFFFSDYHSIANTGYTPHIIKYLCSRLNKIKVFNDGDVLNTHNSEQIAVEILETFASSFTDVDLYNVFGNHDSDPYGSTITIDQYYPLLFKHLECNPNVTMTKQGYYYVDNKVQKIRYIILNTHETGFNLSNADDVEQLDWFCDVLNNVEDGWYVVLLAHMMYDVRLNSVTGLHEVYPTTSGTYIQSILDAYETKQSGSFSTYSYDFTNAHGKVACALIGHVHYDHDEDREAGYPIITILQDAIDYPGLMENNPERKKGTYTEQAFDLISIDTVGKTIKTVRIGAGNNREFTFE